MGRSWWWYRISGYEKSTEREGLRRDCAPDGERSSRQPAVVGQDVRAPDGLSFERRVSLVYEREKSGCGGGHLPEPRVAMVRAVGANALAQGIPDHEGTGSTGWRRHVAGGIRTRPARVA